MLKTFSRTRSDVGRVLLAVKAQATRTHYREPVAAGIYGQGQPLLRAAS